MLSVKSQYEIAIAALLHDIGKFKQRAYKGNESIMSGITKSMTAQILPPAKGGYYSHRHALWTYDFFIQDLIPVVSKISLDEKLDWELIARESSSHHNPNSEGISSIIEKADKISATYDRFSQGKPINSKNDYYNIPLRSIFENIFIKNNSAIKK